MQKLIKTVKSVFHIIYAGSQTKIPFLILNDKEYTFSERIYILLRTHLTTLNNSICVSKHLSLPFNIYCPFSRVTSTIVKHISYNVN